jgi:hypothetical protein
MHVPVGGGVDTQLMCHQSTCMEQNCQLMHVEVMMHSPLTRWAWVAWHAVQGALSPLHAVALEALLGTLSAIAAE